MIITLIYSIKEICINLRNRKKVSTDKDIKDGASSFKVETVYSVSNDSKDVDTFEVRVSNTRGISIKLPPLNISPEMTLPPSEPDYSEIEYNLGNLTHQLP